MQVESRVEGFFFFKFTFNWRIIALQCCVGFTVQQLSQSKVYIYPL